MDQKIREKLRRERRALDVSAESAARALGVTRASITHWERGHREPKPEHLRALRAFYRKLRSELAR